MTEYEAGDRVRVADKTNWAYGRTVYIDRREGDGYRVHFYLPTLRRHKDNEVSMFLLPTSIEAVPTDVHD